MEGTAGPYAWDPHLLAWSVLVISVLAVVLGHRRLVRHGDRPIVWTRHQIGLFSGACVTAAVALTWPMADVAAHWSLASLVAQRLLLVLAVAPMLLLGLPYDVLQWLTRPPLVDAVLVRLQRPAVAIIAVTVLLVGSMTPRLVAAQASSLVIRGVIDAVVVVAGLTLWLPVLGRIPGILRLRPVVRFGYLVAQAVVPAFLSFIFIFSTRPIYPVYAHSHLAIGLRPLNDQQIAGFLSKVSMLLVLLIVGAVVLARAPVADDELGPADPLVWADVERQFERADRRKARAGDHNGSPWGPATADDAVPRSSAGPRPGTGGAPSRDLSEHPHGSGESPEVDGPEIP